MRYRRKPRGKVLATRLDVLELVRPLEWFSVPTLNGRETKLVRGASVSHAIECLREAGFIMREDWFGPMGFDEYEDAKSKRNQRCRIVADEEWEGPSIINPAKENPL